MSWPIVGETSSGPEKLTVRRGVGRTLGRYVDDIISIDNNDDVTYKL